MTRQSIGFIGTGTITQHMVRGLKASALAEMRIILSPRNLAVAQELSEALPGVQIAADNQDVLDRADLILLAVRPQVAAEVIRPLTFAPHKPVISLIATLPQVSQVSTLLGPRLIRRARRPARNCTTKLLRPLGITRSPKPGIPSSQRKNSVACGSVASIVRLVSLGMGDPAR